MDKRTALLLQTINSLCEDGRYKVVEKQDLLAAFPTAFMQGEEGLDGMISYLKEHEYIDVRYADKGRGVYCLYPLPAGRLYAERLAAKRAERNENFKRIFLASFLASLSATLFALGMGAVIYLLIA